jgi:hypothetical protein
MKHTKSLNSRILGLPFVLALVIPAVALPMEDPCIPDGDSQEYEADRPSCPHPDGEWIGGGSGDPKVYDEDLIADDEMGDADPGTDPNTVSVEVSNDNGDLSGPNGETVNGRLDGACAEVYVEWTYRVKHTVNFHYATHTVFEPGGVGGGQEWGLASSKSFYTYHTVRLEPKEICPC